MARKNWKRHGPGCPCCKPTPVVCRVTMMLTFDVDIESIDVEVRDSAASFEYTAVVTSDSPGVVVIGNCAHWSRVEEVTLPAGIPDENLLLGTFTAHYGDQSMAIEWQDPFLCSSTIGAAFSLLEVSLQRCGKPVTEGTVAVDTEVGQEPTYTFTTSATPGADGVATLLIYKPGGLEDLTFTAYTVHACGVSSGIIPFQKEVDGDCRYVWAITCPVPDGTSCTCLCDDDSEPRPDLVEFITRYGTFVAPFSGNELNQCLAGVGGIGSNLVVFDNAAHDGHIRLCGIPGQGANFVISDPPAGGSFRVGYGITVDFNSGQVIVGKSAQTLVWNDMVVPGNGACFPAGWALGFGNWTGSNTIVEQGGCEALHGGGITVTIPAPPPISFSLFGGLIILGPYTLNGFEETITVRRLGP